MTPQNKKVTKATWNSRVLAESSDTIVIEGNYYFPPESINKKLLKKSRFKSLCYWKGLASYYHIQSEDGYDKNAAWYYPKPTWLSKKIMGRDFSNFVAFWENVKISSQ